MARLWEYWPESDAFLVTVTYEDRAPIRVVLPFGDDIQDEHAAAARVLGGRAGVRLIGGVTATVQVEKVRIWEPADG